MNWKIFVLTCIITKFGYSYGQTNPLVQNLQSQFTSKCEKNGHPEVSQNIMTTLKSYETCLSNVNDLPRDMDVGNVTNVIKAVCNTMIKKYVKCWRNMIKTIKPCFSDKEQKSFDTALKVIDDLTEFLCYKDGDRVKEFIANGGIQCWADKTKELNTCINQTVDTLLDNEMNFDLEITKEKCNQLTKFQTCVVNVYKTCKKPVATNIVVSLFDVIRGATPCKEINSASSFAVTTGTVLMALTVAMLV